jgi:hypothetical protein
MSENRQYRVFLSYSSQDREWVSQFVSALRDAGISAWFDVSDIPVGERWDLQVQRALRESTTLIVVLSQRSVKSPWIFFELGAAVAGDKRVIPILIGDVDMRDVPLSLARIQLLREPSPTEAARKVAETLRETEPGATRHGEADEKRA